MKLNNNRLSTKMFSAKTILHELKSLLNTKFPNSVDKVILFGSRVKLRISKYSDYDILIILKTNYDWRFENKIQDLCWEIDYKYNILTDVKIISKKELNQLRGKQLYILHALNEGVAV